MALGIDYSLSMTDRFREERGHGRGKEAALRSTRGSNNNNIIFKKKI